VTQHGKKIGMLEVKLDRKKSRYQQVTVEVELRFDISTGDFWSQYEGNWYTAATKAALSEKIKIAATKSLSIDWKRYIQIDYEAEGWPIEDEKSGRPTHDGQYHTFAIDHDRSKFGRGRDSDEPFAICAVRLQWTICEISEPYALPEEPSKRVRAKRSVGVWAWGKEKGTEKIGDPQEWDDDVLPPGTVLWTAAREALLVEVIGALGNLDRRLVDLFSGDPKQLAGKIDAAVQTDAARLLGPGAALKKRGRS
jgi:hypothetical protein